MKEDRPLDEIVSEQVSFTVKDGVMESMRVTCSQLEEAKRDITLRLTRLPSDVRTVVFIAQDCDPNNFKQSQVRRILRGFWAAVHLAECAVRDAEAERAIREGRSTVEEF